MAILNPTKNEAIEALITLRFYYLNLSKDVKKDTPKKRRLWLDYAEKAYDYEIKASCLEKYGPAI